MCENPDLLNKAMDQFPTLFESDMMIDIRSHIFDDITQDLSKYVEYPSTLLNMNEYVDNWMREYRSMTDQFSKSPVNCYHRDYLDFAHDELLLQYQALHKNGEPINKYNSYKLDFFRHIVNSNPHTFPFSFLQSSLHPGDILFSLDYNPMVLLRSLYKNDDIYFVNGNRNQNVMIVFIKSTSTIYVISFGTSKIMDILTDLGIKEKPFLSGYIHEGFYNRAHEVYEYIEDSISSFITYHNKHFTELAPIRIVLAGHSLGGAVSQVLYFIFKVNHPEYNIFCITYGSPFSVSEELQSIITNNKEILNFICAGDPIPCITSQYYLGPTLKKICSHISNIIPKSLCPDIITNCKNGNYGSFHSIGKTIILHYGDDFVLVEDGEIQEDGTFGIELQYYFDIRRIPTHQLDLYIVLIFKVIIDNLSSI
ncbi:hypothetical protein WA158_003155 [Blastocystis sp. Blastoise]